MRKWYTNLPIALACLFYFLGGAGTLFWYAFLYLHHCGSRQYSFLFCILIDAFCVLIVVKLHTCFMWFFCWMEVLLEKNETWKFLPVIWIGAECRIVLEIEWKWIYTLVFKLWGVLICWQSQLTVAVESTWNLLVDYGITCRSYETPESVWMCGLVLE
jgi:hypothetical protein